MHFKDDKGNELIEIIKGDEQTAQRMYAPVTHCLVVVKVDGDYLLGWNRWRQDWEIFGGCLEAGETMRQCVMRECEEEIGISDVQFQYIGLMSLNLVPDYFSKEHRREYGGLYGICLHREDLRYIEQYRQDREEIGKVALLGDIGDGERIAGIDRILLDCY